MLPGQLWVSALEGLYLIPPSLTNHANNLRYLTGMMFIILPRTYYVGLFFLGSIYPKTGLSMGNHFNVLGMPGQVLSLAVSIFMLLILYLRLRFLRLKDISFLHELVAYDDRKTSTRLSGDNRKRMEAFLHKAVRMLTTGSKVLSTNMIASVVTFSFVTPVMVTGVTLKNILFWAVASFCISVQSYYLSLDWIYIFGSWFLVKKHLDMQAEAISGRLEELIQDDSPTDVCDIARLDIKYKLLVSRVKTFDKLSKDLISPYRFVNSYIYGMAVYAAHKQDNVMFRIALDTVCVSLYIVSLIFLFTACSMSAYRKRMYFLSNQLFVKISRQSRSVKSLLILRLMVKSFGDDDFHPLCLTDKSGQEFEPIEFVEFVGDTFANFMLASSLYFDFVNFR